MKLDRETCLRASASRDPRFDGRFFIGVRTTGIYCRPICPAPAPKPENVRFYATAAAASAAGLRPCRRCRPETAPGTPEWIGGSAVVTRALRLIADGYLDVHDARDLAQQVCVGERQLRRLFEAHLGAPPGAIARTRRVQLARQLIDESELSMTEIAAASGFTSTRRFNEAVRGSYGRSPSELRAARRHGRDARLGLRLPYRPPLAWDNLLSFLGARAVPGVEEIVGGTYRRAVRVKEAVAVVEVEHVDPCRRPAGRESARARPRGDRRALQAPSTSEPTRPRSKLRSAETRSSRRCRVPPRPACARRLDGFELAVRAVLGQQVTVRGARTLAGRLVEQFGDLIPLPSGSVTHTFPQAAALGDAAIERIGLPGARAETIRRLAQAVASGDLDLSPTAPLDTTRARPERRFPESATGPSSTSPCVRCGTRRVSSRRPRPAPRARCFQHRDREALLSRGARGGRMPRFTSGAQQPPS